MNSDSLIFGAIANGPVNVREIASELVMRRLCGSMNEAIERVRRFAFLHRRIGVSSGFAVNYTRTGNTEVISLAR